MNRRFFSFLGINNRSGIKASGFLWSILAALCGFAVPGFAEPQLKGTAPELALLLTNAPRIAEVTGESEIKVEADRGILTVKITTSSRDLGGALRANQEARNKFATSLTTQGISADQIKASKFSSTEKHSVFSDKVRSHRVDNLLKVTVRNEKEFQVVADAIDSLPEAQYLGVDFERSDQEQMKAKAIAQACDNANQRKQVFEEKLGLKLTVRRFLDPSGGMVSPVPVTVTAGIRAQGFLSPSASAPAGSVSDYSDQVITHALAQREADGSGFGELTFRSRVTVEYLVEGR